MPSLHYRVRGYCYDSALILLPIGALGPPVAVCHAAPCLAQPSCRVLAEAHRAGAHQPQAEALQRVETVCGADPFVFLHSASTGICTLPARDALPTRATAAPVASTCS